MEKSVEASPGESTSSSAGLSRRGVASRVRRWPEGVEPTSDRSCVPVVISARPIPTLNSILSTRFDAICCWPLPDGASACRRPQLYPLLDGLRTKQERSCPRASNHTRRPCPGSPPRPRSVAGPQNKTCRARCMHSAARGAGLGARRAGRLFALASRDACAAARVDRGRT